MRSKINFHEHENLFYSASFFVLFRTVGSSVWAIVFFRSVSLCAAGHFPKVGKIGKVVPDCKIYG